MKVTSAYANKMLKQLDEEKEYWTTKEKSSCVYTVVLGEDPIIPDYDYQTTADQIAKIDEQIRVIKHAINKANVESQITVGDDVLSVDTVLVKMAQLNKRKDVLNYMRKQQPKQKKEDRFGGHNTEYQYINFDQDLIKNEFKRVSKEIMDLQMALDKYNQTYEFEIDI